MRTLVVSDMHLGARLERDVLRRDAPLRALLAALQDVDRLVLLGDVVELTGGRATGGMEVAEPVLGAGGARAAGRRGPRRARRRRRPRGRGGRGPRARLRFPRG